MIAPRFWRGLPPQPDAPTVFSRNISPRDSSSSYDLDGATVEVNGKPADVRYDRENGEIVIVGPDFTIRVKSKNPRP
jgi:hypothetical protein